MYIKGNDRYVIQEGFKEKIASRIFTYKSIRELQDNVIKNKVTHIDKVIIDKESPVSNISGMITSHIKLENEYLVIRGIDFTKFFQRIKEYYSENNFSKIFMMIYTNKSEKLWKKGKINRRDMIIKEIKFPLFFSLEIAMIFEDLGACYNVKHYMKIARYIRTNTWLKEIHKPVEKIAEDFRIGEISSSNF